MAGRFITVEGIEGVGKSTHLEFIKQILERAGKQVEVTREPGGTPLAERIRDLVLRNDSETIGEECELLLMFAARAAHLRYLIRPALRAGHWVLCDRFTDATHAYQGSGRGVSRERIATLESWVVGAERPHLTILLDAPVAVALRRADERNRQEGSSDRFEAEQAAFFERVRDGYLRIAAAEPERVQVIDASGTLAEVRTAISEVLDKFLEF